jgi:hypothetical protein
MPSLRRPCLSPQEKRLKPARATESRNEKIGVLVQVTVGRGPLNVSPLLCNTLRASAAFGFEHLGDWQPGGGQHPRQRVHPFVDILRLIAELRPRPVTSTV